MLSIAPAAGSMSWNVLSVGTQLGTIIKESFQFLVHKAAH